MFGKKKNDTAKKVVPVKMKDIHYSGKIILAWIQSLEGDKQISRWLFENGFKELIMCNRAIYLKEDGRDWLMKNGFPHLMAFINAAEGNKKASKWLCLSGFLTLHHMAEAIDGERESWTWLGKNVTADMFLLVKTIEKIKDKIEENHNDIHSFGKD